MLLSGFLAFSVSLAMCPMVAALLRRAEVLDIPNERSSHRRPVPRGAGLAGAVGVVVAAAASGTLANSQKVALIVAVLTLGAIGLGDDLTNMRPLTRLGLQPLAAVLVIPWLLHGIGGSWVTKALIAGAVLVGLVSYVNAYNFMDGIDGIAAAQAFVAGGWWYVVGRTEGAPGFAVGGAILAGAALGFVPYNFPRARAFLGDVGSYALGAGLAVVAVLGLRAGVAAEAVLAPLTLTLADTGFTLVRRIAAGELWYLPHRTHVYQRLTKLGWSHVRTTGVITGLLVTCCLLSSLSLTGSVAARVGGDLVLMLVLTAYLTAPGWLRGRLRPAATGGC